MSCILSNSTYKTHKEQTPNKLLPQSHYLRKIILGEFQEKGIPFLFKIFVAHKITSSRLPLRSHLTSTHDLTVWDHDIGTDKKDSKLRVVT